MKTVKRIRFTEQGEIIEEDTFATENAVQPRQMELAIGSGEQPLETLPLFKDKGDE